MGSQNDAAEALELLAAGAEAEMQRSSRASALETAAAAPQGLAALAGLSAGAEVQWSGRSSTPAAAAAPPQGIAALAGFSAAPKAEMQSGSLDSAVQSAAAEPQGLANIQGIDEQRRSTTEAGEIDPPAEPQGVEEPAGPLRSSGSDAQYAHDSTAAAAWDSTPADPSRDPISAGAAADPVATDSPQTAACLSGSDPGPVYLSDSCQARAEAAADASASLRAWRGGAQLPLQGWQAHELMCARCGSPSATQLLPFYTLSLGAPPPPLLCNSPG